MIMNACVHITIKYEVTPISQCPQSKSPFLKILIFLLQHPNFLLKISLLTNPFLKHSLHLLHRHLHLPNNLQM